MDPYMLLIILGVLIAGALIGFALHRYQSAKSVGDARDLAGRIVEEARKEAEKLLFDACADDGATLIKTTFTFIEKEDGLRGVLTAECILNIAKPVPVEMN